MRTIFDAKFMILTLIFISIDLFLRLRPFSLHHINIYIYVFFFLVVRVLGVFKTLTDLRYAEVSCNLK